MNKDYHLEKRRKYLPKELKLIFIAESPPISGNYFYDSNGKISEQLFRAMIIDIIGEKTSSKAEGLSKFQEAGYLLVDAVYKPVNKELTEKKRNNIIIEGYPDLLTDLSNLSPGKDVPLLLIKANICRLLEPKLVDDGFTVLNHGAIIPFPGSGQQKNFKEKIGPILPQ